MAETKDAKRVRAILAQVKLLAGEYYRLTGKPLGVTGEVAEYVVAQTLGLQLAPPRTEGYDAIRGTPDGQQRIQIKGRAIGENSKPGQRVGKIKRGAPCDTVMLVLLDNATLEPQIIWEATMADVEKRLGVGGSKARSRGSLRVNEFVRLARQIWPNDRTVPKGTRRNGVTAGV
ncbi:MAG: hypothetical protein Q8N51_18855 [Gammaproteobacteria bacterium]|nr:hypothetical protein [Gammaproteobacteria bacterium]